ncbi:unnamed protein product [Cylicocyclus nassatus]|uniref:Integrator complex subunit 4/Protein SIEL C-terminal Ig-like domain-containing protein n=1 Tax=Cylicocyclus nassatus TaxID=53992 RepID=A0AA36GQ02_CYLNA|nr:unnamed protein product [Cylicocyclus nassatus]
MVKAESRAVTSLPKKRKNLQDVGFVPDIKRLKQELLESGTVTRRPVFFPLAKRRGVDILRDVLSRLQGGDRQIASILLREFSVEHLPTLNKDLPEIVSLIITSASVTTYDQIAKQLLRMLLCVMEKADSLLRNSVVQRLLSESAKESNLFTRSYLDEGLLLLLTEALTSGAVAFNSIPIRALRCADRALHSSSHLCRCAAIGFHVARVMNRRPDPTSLLVLEKLLCQMTTDMDSRVRLSATEGLAIMSKVEDGLTVQAYGTVKNLVGDSHRQVRIIALRLLLYFANRIPNFLITSAFSNTTDTKLQLCDDAFSVVCDAVNDQEVMVRTEAATILGQFSIVSDAFLDQTLDKKMMKTVQDASGREQVKKVHQSRFAITQTPQQRESRWKSHYHDQSRHKQYASDWSSGKELNARCPPSGATTSSSDESGSIVPRGACGAFVTALEDEFMSVRRAAVHSLGQLAANRPAFATTALDHLSDMFNDEIVEVRLDAIAALTPLIVHGELQKEQLETVLKCLDDAIIDSRQALRELLTKAEFADAECMRICARALLNCLHRFPADKNSIYRCLSKVGMRHAVFVHGMVRELLGLHLVYDTREQQIDDVYYIAKLVLILNAAANYEPIVSLLPECVLKHYRFLRAAVPDLVPPIKVLEKADSNSNTAASSPSREQAATSADILVNTYERLQEVIREPTLTDRNALRRYIADDANAISAFNEPLAGAAQFIASLCEISSALESLTQMVLRGGDIADAANTVHQELVRVRCAEYQFAGISVQMASFLVEAGMFLSLLQLLVEATSSPERYPAIVLGIRSVIADAQNRWAVIGPPSEQALALISAIQEPLDCIQTDGKKILSAATFGHLLVNHTPSLPQVFSDIGNIKTKWAQITEPNRDVALEKPLRFVAGLPCGVQLVASLHNLEDEDLQSLRVQIEYPNNSRDYFHPRSMDISKEGNIISSKVLISSVDTWSDAADVTLTLVLLAHSFSHKLVSVPLVDSPSSAQPASVRLRVHPMTRT